MFFLYITKNIDFVAKIHIFIDFGVKIQIIEKLNISEKEHFGAKIQTFEKLVTSVNILARKLKYLKN